MAEYYIDAHCHLTDERVLGSQEKWLARARESDRTISVAAFSSLIVRGGPVLDRATDKNDAAVMGAAAIGAADNARADFAAAAATFGLSRDSNSVRSVSNRW